MVKSLLYIGQQLHEIKKELDYLNRTLEEIKFQGGK